MAPPQALPSLQHDRPSVTIPAGVGGTHADLDKATAQAEMAIVATRVAEAALNAAQLDLQATRITSPIAGRIGRHWCVSLMFSANVFAAEVDKLAEEWTSRRGIP